MRHPRWGKWYIGQRVRFDTSLYPRARSGEGMLIGVARFMGTHKLRGIVLTDGGNLLSFWFKDSISPPEKGDGDE